MSKEKEILNALLERYERSSAFKDGEAKRRVLIHPDDYKFYNSHTEKKEFLSSLETLKRDGLVDYDWKRMNEGNLVDSIWLNLADEKIEKSYEKAERIKLDAFISTLSSLLKEGEESVQENEIKRFFAFEREKAEKNKKVPLRYFSPTSNDINKEIIKSVVAIANNKSEESLRIFSTRVFGDSKAFERNMRSPSLTILKAAFDFVDLNDDEILSLFNIRRYPEVMEFKAHLKVFFKDGSAINFSALNKGAYINSSSVFQIDHVELDAKSIMSIENKANYYEYIASSGDDEAVFFHGGFHSPAKKKFLSFIKDAVKDECPIYHWSDIDLGGFNIFNSVKDVFEGLIAYKMDAKTLLDNIDKAQEIKDKKYLEKVEKALSDQKYEAFFSVLKIMKEKRIKLEQESLLI